MIGNQEMRSEENQSFDELMVKSHQSAPVHPGYIARSVASVIRRTQESLSPWVQRWWQAEPPAAAPGLRREPSVARQHRVALSETETRSLLGRLQRTVDRSVVGRADVGPIEPGMVDRFTHAIVDRFRPIAPKYEPRTLELDPDQASELVLATGPLPAIVGRASPSELSPESLMGRVAPSSFSPALPSDARVQRTVVSSPSARRPVPSSPPVPPSPRPSSRGQRVRFFSRVEEIPAETSATVPDSPSGLLSSALEPLPVQRQLDEEIPSPPLSRHEEALAAGPSRTEEPVSPVEVEGSPNLPPSERVVPDRAEMPPVRRQLDEEIPPPALPPQKDVRAAGPPQRVAVEGPPSLSSGERITPGRAETPPVQRQLEEVSSPALPHREGSPAVDFSGVEEPVSPVMEGSLDLSLSGRDVPDRAETPPVQRQLEEIPPPALPPQKDVRAAGPSRVDEPVSPVTVEGPSLPSSGRGVPDRAETPPVQRQLEEIPPPALPHREGSPAAESLGVDEPVFPVTVEGPPSFSSSGRGVPDRAETPPVQRQLEEIPPPALPHREGMAADESLGVDEPASPMTVQGPPAFPSSQKAALERAETLLERGQPATPMPPVQRQLDEKAPHPALPHREEVLPAEPSGMPEGPVDLLPDRESLPDRPEAPAGSEESPPLIQRQLDVEISPSVPSRREDLPVADELSRTEGDTPLGTVPGLPGPFLDQEVAPEKRPVPLPLAPSPSLQRQVGLEMPYRVLPDQEDGPSAEPSRMDEPTAELKNEIVARAALRSRRPLTGNLPSSQVSIVHRGTRPLLAAQRWRFKPLRRASSAEPGRIARAVDDPGQDPGRGRLLERESREAMEEIVSRDFGEVRTAHLSLPGVKATAREGEFYVESGQGSFESPRSLALLGRGWAHAAQSGFAGTRPVVQTAILPQARAPARFGNKEVKAEEDERRGFLPLLSTPRVTGMPLWQPVEERRELDSVGLSHALEAEFPLPPVSHPVSAETIQRQPAGDAPDLAATLGSMGIVQRATETPSETDETSEEASSGLDLDDLARQIYPLVKRMLAVERERRSGRWR